MRITKLTVSAGMTISQGKYEFFRTDLSAEAEVDDNDNIVTVHKKLTKLVKKRLLDQAEDINNEVFDFLRD